MEVQPEKEVEEVRKKLIEACISYNPKAFLPYLLDPIVKVDFPNKIRFYSFFSTMLTEAMKESIGALEVRIEESYGQGKDMVALDFYDQVHKYPRINLLIREERRSFLIDIWPF